VLGTDGGRTSDGLVFRRDTGDAIRAVAGSGLKFDDRGLHTLKGVPGEAHLFALDRGGTAVA
jgi:hypothetical protein